MSLSNVMLTILCTMKNSTCRYFHRPCYGWSLLSDGLHQALEAKEGLEITEENQTQASITIQNFFRMYPALSGMTGTAKTEEKEFNRVYNMEVIPIPTNRPIIREDKRTSYT